LGQVNLACKKKKCWDL